MQTDGKPPVAPQRDWGTQTGVVLPDRAAPIAPAPPEATVEDIAKRAAVGDTVILSEIESDDFLEAIQDLIDYIQMRAWPELEANVMAAEQTLAEQIDDISYQRAPLVKLETQLGERRAELAELDGEIKARDAAMFRGGVPRGNNNNNNNNNNNFVRRYDVERMRSRKNAIENEISDLENRIRVTKDRFSRVPNESVYKVAFDALAMYTEAYAAGVRAQAARVMNMRKDGPLLKIDKDAFEQAADALGKALSAVETAFQDMLLYDGTGDNERGTIKIFDGSLVIDLRNVENALELEDKPGRLAVYERIRIGRFNAYTSAMRRMQAVHREIAKRLTKPVNFRSSIDRFDLGVTYALKLSRIGLIFAASHISTRVFENIYVDRMTSKDPDVPDLKWLVFAFIVTCLLFDGVVIGMAYMVAKTLPSQLDMRIIKDFALDTLVAHTMSGLSLFSLADVIQDKRYFDYQVTAMRALRLMRQLCFSIEAFHAVTPYFYLMGPFYMQHKQAATADVL